jgi:RNA polymerase sigma factor (sigma-70 family)
MNNEKNKKTFSDIDIVNGILIQEERIILYFFFEKCTLLFQHINNKIFDKQAEQNELINDFYLYLQEDNWHKLRLFDSQKSKLITWISTIAIRFFRKKQIRMIENQPLETIYKESEYSEEQIYQKLDIESLMKLVSNERYREVIRLLILEDQEPQKIANAMGITVDNLYNIKSRAQAELIRTVERYNENLFKS